MEIHVLLEGGVEIGPGVAANLYIREYVSMGIDSLRLGIDSL